MLDELKKQRIVQLVQMSNILNVQEKADWLSLLELMNDKQLAELEEILQARPSAIPVMNKSKAIDSKPSIEIQQPTLKHISNLPTQISNQRMSVPVKPRPTPIAVVPIRKVPMQAGLNMQNSHLVKPITKEQTATMESFKQPVRTDVGPAPLNLTKLEDVAKISTSVLHQESRKNFYTAILGMAGEMGYFQTLSYLETSPLYRDYISYGKIKLSGVGGQQLPLTHEEFEFMTDLLLALKINRV